jgi:hypothetical protein
MEKMMNPDFDKELAKFKVIAEMQKTCQGLEETRTPAQNTVMAYYFG